MNIKEIGTEGEQEARRLLQQNGFYIGQSDWIGEKNNQWYRFEVKRKERFTAPPFDGHGLDTRQIRYAERFKKATGISTYLIVYELGTNEWYAAKLDTLLLGRHFETKNKVTIFDIDSFKKIKKPE